MRFNSLPEGTLYAFPPTANLPVEKCKFEFENRRFEINKELPLAIYIHVPYCSYICNFCGFIRSDKLSKESISHFETQALKELDLLIEKFDIQNRALSSIFFGGGSASLLEISSVERILAHINQRFSVTEATSLTFEGECLSLSKRGYVESLKSFGFQRISFGVQTVDPELRKMLNIKPPLHKLASLSEHCNALFDEFSIDLIYGWPNQSLAHVTDDVSKALELCSPKSIDLFRFEKYDANPMFMSRLYEAGARDLSSDAILEMYRAISELLIRRGFKKVTTNYFTAQVSPLLGEYAACYYGWNSGEVIGIGRGAQSFFGGCMWGNALTPADYEQELQKDSIPIADFAEYDPQEKEFVTWAKKGWIAKSRVPSTSEASQKIEFLKHNGYVNEQQNQYQLSGLGELWVPAIMDYLMPAHHHNVFVDFNQAKENLILRS